MGDSSLISDLSFFFTMSSALHFKALIYILNSQFIQFTASQLTRDLDPLTGTAASALGSA